MSIPTACIGPLSKSDEARFWPKVIPNPRNGCWEWQFAVNANGYGKFNVNGRNRFAHRVAYELKNGPIPFGLIVIHSCDNPRCCNPEHLRIGTVKDNSLDAVLKGRKICGEKVHFAKLTNDRVREIRALHSSGVSRREICDLFGLKKTTVGCIVRGLTWPRI